MTRNDLANNNKPREGCIDLWNASLLKDATYTLGNDIPVCQKCTGIIPMDLISYDEAKAIHKKTVKKEPDYHINKTVHFFIDDQKFDGNRESIWLHPEKLIELLHHYSGVISPDFSTYADFPDSLKRYNIYRMRAFDYIFQMHDIPVIHNVRWGTSETWSYCFDGIPLNGIIAIGVVASGINKICNRSYFKDGLIMAIKTLKPHTIIIYGSDHYDLFSDLRTQGINIVSFDSKTSLAYKKVKKS
ncbi:MAG: DUF4417 domain-containing protein [Clostridiales bacterium]|nr:DUF4417 domain-containing protein [Clostridiales bacterium]